MQDEGADSLGVSTNILHGTPPGTQNDYTEGSVSGLTADADHSMASRTEQFNMARDDSERPPSYSIAPNYGARSPRLIHSFQHSRAL